MAKILPITCNGQLVAAVMPGQAIIRTDVPDEDRARIEAMCMYAGEVLEGRTDGPYSDEDALAYADAVAARRATHPTR